MVLVLWGGRFGKLMSVIISVSDLADGDVHYFAGNYAIS